MALTCAACDKPIAPGSKVVVIGREEGQRIVTSDEALVRHATCPPVLDPRRRSS